MAIRPTPPKRQTNHTGLLRDFMHSHHAWSSQGKKKAQYFHLNPASMKLLFQLFIFPKGSRHISSAFAEKSCAHVQQPVTHPPCVLTTKPRAAPVWAAQDTPGFWLTALSTAQPHRVSCAGRLEDGRTWEGGSDLYKTLILPQKLFESMSSKILFSLLKKKYFSKAINGCT